VPCPVMHAAMAAAEVRPTMAPKRKATSSRLLAVMGGDKPTLKTVKTTTKTTTARRVPSAHPLQLPAGGLPPVPSQAQAHTPSAGTHNVLDEMSHR
jgi:hypothetical protein